MTRINASIILCTVFLCTAVFGICSVASADQLRVTFQGTITHVYGGIDPLWDPIEPVEVPPADPLFEQMFAVGQPVRGFVAYDTSAEDWYDTAILATPKIGIFDAITSAEVSVAGCSYLFTEGHVSAELETSWGEDQIGFEARGYQSITTPITANGIRLWFGIAAPSMLINDSIPVQTPASWTRDFGHVSLGSVAPGLEYRYFFDISELQIVPEPSTLALMTIGCAALHRSRSQSEPRRRSRR